MSHDPSNNKHFLLSILKTAVLLNIFAELKKIIIIRNSKEQHLFEIIICNIINCLYSHF